MTFNDLYISTSQRANHQSIWAQILWRLTRWLCHALRPLDTPGFGSHSVIPFYRTRRLLAMLHGWHLHGTRAFWSISRACSKETLMQRCLRRISFLFYHVCTKRAKRVHSCSLPRAWETISRTSPQWIPIRFRFHCPLATWLMILFIRT